MRMPFTHRGVGVDRHDPRDATYAPPAATVVPSAIELAMPDWPAWNQEATNSCTAHVVAAAAEILLYRRDAVRFEPSRLFVYYNARIVYDMVEDRTADAIDHDAPVYLKDAMNAVQRWGACAESAWPDVNMHVKSTTKPDAAAYSAATPLHGFAYATLAREPRDIDAMKSCLAAGHPIGMSFWEPAGYMDDAVCESGDLPPPTAVHFQGHAVLLTGYDDRTGRFSIRNSHGPADWGRAREGNGTMPYEYATDPAASFSLWAMFFRDGSGFPLVGSTARGV